MVRHLEAQELPDEVGELAHRRARRPAGPGSASPDPRVGLARHPGDVEDRARDHRLVVARQQRDFVSAIRPEEVGDREAVALPRLHRLGLDPLRPESDDGAIVRRRPDASEHGPVEHGGGGVEAAVLVGHARAAVDEERVPVLERDGALGRERERSRRRCGGGRGGRRDRRRRGRRRRDRGGILGEGDPRPRAPERQGRREGCEHEEASEGHGELQVDGRSVARRPRGGAKGRQKAAGGSPGADRRIRPRAHGPSPPPRLPPGSLSRARLRGRRRPARRTAAGRPERAPPGPRRARRPQRRDAPPVARGAARPPAPAGRDPCAALGRRAAPRRHRDLGRLLRRLGRVPLRRHPRTGSARAGEALRRRARPPFQRHGRPGLHLAGGRPSDRRRGGRSRRGDVAAWAAASRTAATRAATRWRASCWAGNASPASSRTPRCARTRARTSAPSRGA